MVKIAARRSAQAALDYFLAHPALTEDERLGAWTGRCSETLSLPTELGPIAPEELGRALTGFAPCGPQVGRPLFRNAFPTPRVGWELVFAPHKSVSLAALQTRLPDLARRTRESFQSAVLDTFRNVVEPLARARTKIVANAKSASLLGAVFVHQHSRRHDPHLHAHILAFNTTQAPSGAWHRLEPRSIYAQIRRITGEFHVRLTKALLLARVAVELRPTGKLEAAVVPSLLPYCEAVSRGRQSLLELAGTMQMPLGSIAGRWLNRLNDRSRPEKASLPTPAPAVEDDDDKDKEDTAGADGFRTWTKMASPEEMDSVPVQTWRSTLGRSASHDRSQTNN